MRRRVFWLGLIVVQIVALMSFGSHHSSLAADPTPMPGMGMHPIGRVNIGKDKQVAPAVTAMLMRASSRACGHAVTGSGTVKMIPVHVGRMSGPHVDLIVNLRRAGMMRKYGISGAFTGVHSWSGMAANATTGMRGNLYITTRLMPMLRAGHYMARITVRDMSCRSMMMSLAYETPKVAITLR
jgi:hypothetical protein